MHALELPLIQKRNIFACVLIKICRIFYTSTLPLQNSNNKFHTYVVNPLNHQGEDGLTRLLPKYFILLYLHNSWSELYVTDTYYDKCTCIIKQFIANIRREEEYRYSGCSLNANYCNTFYNVDRFYFRKKIDKPCLPYPARFYGPMVDFEVKYTDRKLMVRLEIERGIFTRHRPGSDGQTYWATSSLIAHNLK